MTDHQDDEFIERVSAALAQSGARLAVVAVITPDDSMRVAVIGSGQPIDADDLEETFAELIETLRGDLSFAEVKGNA